MFAVALVRNILETFFLSLNNPFSRFCSKIHYPFFLFSRAAQSGYPD